MAHNLKPLYALGLLSLLVLVQKGGAYEFMVGGSNGWTVPIDSNAMNQWAGKSRFQIGDSLLFVYPADKDALLQVNKDDYENCNTDTTPIAKYTDGHTTFTFNQSGPYYFISGVKDNCLKNEKLVVVVMADRTIKSPPPPTVASPPPTPPPSPPPPAASPPPAAEDNPSPPPGPEEGTPSTAPSADQTPPPPSSATTLAMGFIGSIGAFLGFSVLLVL